MSAIASMRSRLNASGLSRSSAIAASVVGFNAHSNSFVRSFAFDSGKKLKAPEMVYISGEEMTHYTMGLIVDQWIKPYMDTSAWKHFNLSCKSRDDTEDKVLHDAVKAGAQIGAIFKEPTITPTAVQKEKMGLKKAWGSPNGAMRRGWNGITISRDTIHIDGIRMGYKRPVLCERQAVGGEYQAGWSMTKKGRVVTTFFPDDSEKAEIVESRRLDNEENAVVVYSNPLDNVPDLADIFFDRCLKNDVVPYVVTKKTVFKWQEGFWQAMKKTFDEKWKSKFVAAGLLDNCGGELQHLISDAATMQIVRWTNGGFGMACHNYDGDMLTDEVAQVHRSPGFMNSVLIGKSDEGNLIKEFEASHGTVTDMYEAMLRGEETSLNPLGMVEALFGAISHAASLNSTEEDRKQIDEFITTTRRAVHNTFRYGQGTRDMAGAKGLTTEDFVRKVAWRQDRYVNNRGDENLPKKFTPPVDERQLENVDMDAVKVMFNKYDLDGSGNICQDEFVKMLIKLNVAPLIDADKNKIDEVEVKDGAK